TPTTPPPAPAPARGSGTVDVINATDRNGLAAGVEHALPGTGFTPGLASTAARHRTTTMIYYPDPGSATTANTLATMLGAPPTPQDSTVPTGHLRVILGANFTMPENLPTTTPAPAAAPHHSDPTPTEPSGIASTGVPCVK